MPNLLNQIAQLGIITPNAAETLRQLQTVLRLGAFKLWDFKYPSLFDTTLHDRPEPWRMILSLGWVGEMQVEVIQPTAANNLYQTFLAWKHGRAGLQHFVVDRGTTPYLTFKARLAEMGFPLAQSAISNPAVQLGPLTLPPIPQALARRFGTRYGYTDTFETLKISVEISQFPPGLTPRAALRLGKGDQWIGDPAYFEALPANSLISTIAKIYILVNDLDAVLPHYQKFQPEPLRAFEVTLTDQLRHTPLTMRLAFIPLRSTQIVLAQPLDEHSVFAEVLRARGEGGQIIGATSRYAEAAELTRQFQQQGFTPAAQVVVDQQTLRYFTHPTLPFDVEIALSNQG